LQAARESLASLLAIAVAAGFLIGITSNVAAAYLIERTPRWPGLAISAATTLLLPMIYIWGLYRKNYSMETVIEIVVPFRVTATDAEILNARPYPITKLLRRSFSGIINNHEHKARFLRDWQQSESFRDSPANVRLT
jgi:hypothetical protein